MKHTDPPVPSRFHVRPHRPAHPDVAVDANIDHPPDVLRGNLVELGKDPDSSVADENVDTPPRIQRGSHHGLGGLLVSDAVRVDNRLAAEAIDLTGDRVGVRPHPSFPVGPDANVVDDELGSALGEQSSVGAAKAGIAPAPVTIETRPSTSSRP
jgi:hypothetical protein